MLYVFGFDRLGVVLSDLFFRDPNPTPGQEGAEQGIRLELRFLEAQEREGSIYASRPIVVGRPVWRVDLLESVEDPGSLNRAHHHPKMQGWEPGARQFEPELTADPVGWVGDRLEDAAGLLEAAGVEDDGLVDDLEQLRATSPEILDALRRMLGRITRGELARAPAGTANATFVRAGWL